jgi:hypothetical protein
MFMEEYNLQSKGEKKKNRGFAIVYTITFFEIEQLFHCNKSSMFFTTTKKQSKLDFRSFNRVKGELLNFRNIAEFSKSYRAILH